mmetsp:Transcript_626/g.1472  ORF Transcript_626/g.1472 Transcript_626/m.1472 type:complete len:358 (-) Transcript_626:70-1143(-)
MSRCGTPNFVAPEVYEGRAYGTAVDVWSAGVLLYVLLCGFLPFEQTEIDAGQDGIVMVPKIGKLEFPSPHWTHISAEARDLVAAMLQLQPEKRISISAVQEHAWVRGFLAGELPSAPMPQMQRRLRELRSRKLMAAVHSLTALRRMRTIRDWPQLHRQCRDQAQSRLASVQADEAREAELRESFELLDRDSTERISFDNLADSMAALGVVVTEGELGEMLRRFDLFQTGDISFQEFCIMMAAPDPMRSLPSFPSSELDADGDSDSDCVVVADEELEDELRQTFDALDVDKSGFIDAANLREVLSRFGAELSEEEAQEMLKQGDVKGNGVIDLDEFFTLVCRPLPSGQQAVLRTRGFA